MKAQLIFALIFACFVQEAACLEDSVVVIIAMGSTFLVIGLSCFLICYCIINSVPGHKLRKHYNVVDTKSMALAEFESNQKAILDALHSKNSFRYFFKKSPN